ncbi:MAG: hypothetical protein ACRDHF_12545, partial [Tepidiformaceae bacterium]
VWRGLVVLFACFQRQLTAEGIQLLIGTGPSGPTEIPAEVDLDKPPAPAALRQQPLDRRLRGFLEDWDRNAWRLEDNDHSTKVTDYADITDRMNFIVAVFRRYQQEPLLLEEPFNADDLKKIEAGEVPRWVNSPKWRNQSNGRVGGRKGRKEGAPA